MKEKKGFTLIELLVVIAIIALLLAILMPSLQIAKEKAAGVVCLSNLSNMGKAWYAYASENDSEMVNGGTGYASYHWVNGSLTDSGTQIAANSSEVKEKINGIKKGALYSYLNDPKVYHCPGDKRSTKVPKKGGSGKGGYRSYSIPCGMNGGGWSGVTPLKKQTQLRSSDSKYIFVEEMDGRGYNMGGWAMTYTSPSWVDPVAVWHNESSTLAFADGHAESHKWHGGKLIQMTENETFYSGTLTDVDDIDDYEFMLKGYAHENNR